MNILKIKEFKAFRAAFILLHKTTHCASQSLWATLSPRWREMHTTRLNSSTDVYDIYRLQLSSALEFSVLTTKAAQCDQMPEMRRDELYLQLLLRLRLSAFQLH